MIFTPELARAILAARKTVVRIPIRPSHQHVWTDAQGRTHHQTVCPYRVGHSYAIQPGGKTAIGRFLVISIEQAKLMDLEFADARAEGFKVQRDFYDHWLQTHGHIDPDQRVWVIGFVLDQDMPRFLAATPGRLRYSTAAPAKPGAKGRWRVAPNTDEHQDYTNRASLGMTDAGEPVPREVQAEMSREASERDDRMRREWLRERESMTLSERVRDLEGLTNGRRANVSRELRVIEDRIGRAEKGLK